MFDIYDGVGGDFNECGFLFFKLKCGSFGFRIRGEGGVI